MKKYVLQGADNDAEMATMRNVAGEIKGAEAAVKKAIELGVKELVIYYDYKGIEMWATGDWNRNKAGTIAYHEYIMSVKDKIKAYFCKGKRTLRSRGATKRQISSPSRLWGYCSSFLHKKNKNIA